MRLAPLLFLAAIAAASQGWAQEEPAFGQLRGVVDAEPAEQAAEPPAPEEPAQLDETTTASIRAEPPENLPVGRLTPEPPVDTSDADSGFVTGLGLRRTIDDDPFAPLGIRAGSFILFPAVDLTTGYTTNAAGTANGKGSGFFIVAPELVARSDWSRHAAELAMRGSYETFTDKSIADRTSAEVRATGRVDFADQWTMDLLGLYTFGQESLSDPNLPIATDKAPDVNTLTGEAALNGGAGPGVFTLAGRIDRTTYGKAVIGGVTVDQADRNNTLFGGRLRLGYQITPTLTPFIEGELTNRLFDERVDADGVQRSSHGQALRVGLIYDYEPVTRAEIAVGALRESFADPAFAPITAFAVDGSIAWSPTELVTVTGTVATAVNPATNPDSSGSVTYDGMIDVAYLYRRNVSFNAFAGIRNEDFEGTNQLDRTHRLGLGAAWRINRFMQLKAGYEHQWLDSTVAGRDYASDTVRLDLRVQR